MVRRISPSKVLQNLGERKLAGRLSSSLQSTGFPKPLPARFGRTMDLDKVYMPATVIFKQNLNGRDSGALYSSSYVPDRQA
jgi:hypothetical protein